MPPRRRPPALAALRAHARRRVPVGVERGRHRDAGRGGRRARARGRRARMGRRGALRAARADRRPGCRRRRPALLAVQVLRPAPRARVRAARAARVVAAVQGAPVRRLPGRAPLRDGHARARAARGLRRRGRVPRATSAGTSSPSTSASSVSGSSTGCRRAARLHGIPSMDGRVPTFAITHESESPEAGRDAPRRPRLRRRGTATTTPSRS